MLRDLLLRWVCLAAAVWFTTAVVPGIDVDGGLGTYLLVAAVFATVNAVLGTIVRLLTLPLVLLTLGLFSLVVNALMLQVTDALMDSLEVDGFWWAVVAALVIAVVSALLEVVVLPKEDVARA